MAGQYEGRRATDLQGELSGELLAGQAADTVGAKEGHEQPFRRWRKN